MGKLVGECIRCGTCCMNIQFVLQGDDVLLEWVRARGFKIIQANNGFVEIQIPCACPHYKDGGCDIHETKPLTCKEYPKNMPKYWMQRCLDPNKSLGEQCGFRYIAESEECPVN